jgi:hypothetical protein
MTKADDDSAQWVATKNRRLEVASSLYLAELRDDPDKWQILAALLVLEPEIWAVIERLSKAGGQSTATKAGRKTVNTESRLEALAVAWRQYSNVPSRKGKSRMSLIREFKKTLGEEFVWLKTNRRGAHIWKKDETVENKIIEGEHILDSKTNAALWRYLRARAGDVSVFAKPLSEEELKTVRRKKLDEPALIAAAERQEIANYFGQRALLIGFDWTHKK